MPNTDQTYQTTRRGFLKLGAAALVLTPVFAAQAQVKNDNPENMLDAIQIPANIAIVEQSSGRPVNFPTETKIVLPSVYRIEAREGERRGRAIVQPVKFEDLSAHIIVPDHEGVFRVPEAAIFIIPGEDGEERRSFEGLIFEVDEGTDFLQIVPSFKYAPHSDPVGNIVEISADKVHRFENGRYAATPALIAQFDWLGDMEDIKSRDPRMAERIIASYDNRNPDSDLLQQTTNHVNTYHGITTEDLYICTFISIKIASRRYEQEHNPGPSNDQ